MKVITFPEGDIYTQILRPVNAEEAIVEGLGRSLGETIRIIEDKEGGELLTFSGLQLKRVE